MERLKPFIDFSLTRAIVHKRFAGKLRLQVGKGMLTTRYIRSFLFDWMVAVTGGQ